MSAPKSTAFFDAVKTRRTVYGLSSNLPISHEAVVSIVENAIQHHPTSFNSQSSRAVILFGDDHKKIWQITHDALKAIVPEEHFPPTEEKIKSFAAGHGTIVWYVDRADVSAMETAFPQYAAAFPPFAQQSVGMAQYIVWTALATEGVGASLQHYGELVKDKVRAEWKISETWDLISMQPFGAPSAEWKNPEKAVKPFSETLKVFSA